MNLYRGCIVAKKGAASKMLFRSLIRENGCFPTNDMQTPSPLLRSGHLDIKDAKCAKNKYGHEISYHIILHLGAAGVQKGRFGRPKIQLSSKVAKFAG